MEEDNNAGDYTSAHSNAGDINSGHYGYSAGDYNSVNKNSGYECSTNRETGIVKTCDGKIVEIDGIEYELKLKQ